MPVGAVIAQKSYLKKFSLSFSMSASSYAGNGLACRAALTTLEILQQQGLVPDVVRKGDILIKEISAIVRKHDSILRSVDGRGLLIGLEAKDAKVAHQIVRHMINDGVLILPAFAKPSVLMIEPPFVISDAEIGYVLESIKHACGKVI